MQMSVPAHICEGAHANQHAQAHVKVVYTNANYDMTIHTSMCNQMHANTNGHANKTQA